MNIYRDNNFKQSNFKAGLYLISTPIGNLSDISLRALEAFSKLDEIFCEDTSQTIKLLNFYDISRPLRRYHEFSDEAVRQKIISLINEGKSVGLVSDAGTPTISDPGYKLVNMARLNGVDVFSIVGPVAFVAALTISGLPTDKVYFAGFCPRKRGDKELLLQNLKSYQATIIFYETANRLKTTIEMFELFFPGQQICVAREITKKHEEVIRGSAQDIISDLEKRELKGEMVVLLDNNNCLKDGGAEEVKLKVEDFISLFADDVSPSKLSAKLSKLFGLSKRDIYNLILKIKS